jgi:hypothetical protein
VSTAEEDQNPETQFRPLREHLAAPPHVADAGAFGDHAGADQLRGREEWRRLLDLARARQVDPVVVWKPDRAFRSVLDGASALQSRGSTRPRRAARPCTASRSPGPSSSSASTRRRVPASG